MSLWLVRAGRHGEFEKKFLEDGKIFLTWGEVKQDLSKLLDKDSLRGLLEETYPDAPKGRITNNRGQIWAFVNRLNLGDWVVLPSKHKPAIHVAEIVSDYVFDPNAESPYNHYRAVKWIECDIPRSNFDQDLLHSFGAFMTVCQISRNDAEKRVRDMATKGWKSSPGTIISNDDDSTDADTSDLTDISQAARDQIAKLIIARFSGHGMATLVDAVLRAQGYATYKSPEGPDKGVDILAAPAPLGFGDPRICVQVKSGDTPVDRPTLDQLIGTMQNVHASHGLLVSWGGFKSSVDKEEAAQFFRVRLWDQDDLIDQVLKHYGELPEEICTELPMKRIWVISLPEE